MKLTTEQKENLSGLMKHPWLKVAELVISDYEMKVLQGLKKINTSNTEELALLNAKQNYLAWLEDALKTLKGNSQAITQRKL